MVGIFVANFILFLAVKIFFENWLTVVNVIVKNEVPPVFTGHRVYSESVSHGRVKILGNMLQHNSNDVLCILVDIGEFLLHRKLLSVNPDSSCVRTFLVIVIQL